MAYPPPYQAQYPNTTMTDGPPPPAYVYQAPGSNVTVVQPVVVQQKPQKKKGFLDSLVSEVDKFGKQISKELDYASQKVSEAIDKNYTSNLLNLFANGNTLQLIPRSCMKTVQITLNPQGQMLLDANGPLDPRPFNTWWTVVNEGSNQVRLHNNNNYLAIIQGSMTVLPMAPGTALTQQTKFQLSQSGSFVTMECLGDKGKYLGFLHTGQPKLPCGIRKEIDTQFAVKLLSTGYPQQGVAMKH